MPIIVLMEFFLLLIMNSLPVLDLLTIFLVTFLFIEQTAKIKKAIKLIFVNLMKSFRTLY